jgi:hypothetical protein
MWVKEYIPITLKAMEGKQPKEANGRLYNRVFKRENKLYAFKLKGSTFWKLRYENGYVPKYLRDQVFTSIGSLMKVVKPYYATRNVDATLA